MQCISCTSASTCLLVSTRVCPGAVAQRNYTQYFFYGSSCNDIPGYFNVLFSVAPWTFLCTLSPLLPSYLILISIILLFTSLFRPVVGFVSMATNLGPQTNVWACKHSWGERVEMRRNERERRDRIQITLQTLQRKIHLSAKGTPALQR